MENCIFFKWDNSLEIKSLPIQGVKIQVKDLRQRIEQLYNPKKDDFQLHIEGKVLDISDEARNKQTVNIVRIPKYYNMNCHSCYKREFELLTPCCSKQICSVCDFTFSQKSKCFFNSNQQCHYKYSENFQQSLVPEPPLNDFITYSSVFYVLRGSRQMIATAKRYSAWTTREMNYLKMSQDLNIPANVILIFINNDEFLGCAKMINQFIDQPKVQQKTFKIQWIRKQSSMKFVSEFPIDTRDGSKILPGIGKSICYSFPIGQQLVECKQQQQQSPPEEVEWDLDEIFRDQEETVKKDENKQEIKEKTTDFNHEVAKKEDVKINTAVETLSHTQQLFDKINNGQIPGIKGNVKYAHPLLKTLFLGMIESSLTQLNGQNKTGKKRSHSYSQSEEKEKKINEKSNSKSSSSSSKKEKKQLKIREKREQNQKNSQRKKVDRDDEINKRIKAKKSKKRERKHHKTQRRENK